jgi:hypothetical protein
MRVESLMDVRRKKGQNNRELVIVKFFCIENESKFAKNIKRRPIYIQYDISENVFM